MAFSTHARTRQRPTDMPAFAACCVWCRGWVRWPRSQPAWPCPWQRRLPTSCRSRQPPSPPTSPKNLPQPTSPTNPCLLQWMRRNRYAARLGSMSLDNTAGNAVAHPVLCVASSLARAGRGDGACFPAGDRSALPSLRRAVPSATSPSVRFFLFLPSWRPDIWSHLGPFFSLFFVAVASFGEGESHLHESVKMSSPIVPRVLPPPTARADCCGRLETWASLTPTLSCSGCSAQPRRNSLHDLLSESGGYASDGDKSGQDVGWKRKWGMGALIDMLKPKEAEPVYLIKPVRTPPGRSIALPPSWWSEG